MSKRFKTQDYFRYRKLGRRWRRPVGLQSKLRLKKGGSGLRPAVGCGTAGKPLPLIVYNVNDLQKDCSNGVLIACPVGAKKGAAIAAKAKELGIKILNMKKAKSALKMKAYLEKRGSEKKAVHEKKEVAKAGTKATAKKEVKTEAKGEVGHAEEKKIGFDDDVVPEVLKGKTKTYRLRDHDLKVGDKVVFENTQGSGVFGHAKITKVEHVAVGKFNLQDPEHYKIYSNVEELIAALQKRNPDREVTPETEMFAYTYEFNPVKSGKKK